MQMQSRMLSFLVRALILSCGLAVGACGFARERGDRAERDGQDAVRGMQANSLSVGGRQREYLLFVPQGLDAGRPMPLVIVLHGGGGRAQGMIRVGMNDIAEVEGFMVAYPDGIGRGKKHSWNAGSKVPQGYAEEVRVDDVGFISKMIDDIAARHRLDDRRVYVTGLSKGGMLAYRLACELSPRIAAIAPVAATMVLPECKPSRPVAVFHVHGSADQNVPLNGGRGDYTGANANYPSVPSTIDQWRQFNQCQGQPKQEKISSADCTRYEGCRATVELCVIEGSDHGWPGVTTKKARRVKQVDQDFDTTSEVWRFFAHQKAQP